MEKTLSPDQFVMVTILVKLGVMASIASLLIRFGAFKRLLYKDELSLKEKLIFALLSGMLLSFGVIVRLLLNYDAADLSLSGTLLVALLTGPLTGAGVGLMVGAPAFFNGELLALPAGVLYGVSGGVVRELCRKEDIARAYVTGEAIEALCGHRWVPSRDPDRYPVCRACEEELARLNGAGQN